MSVRIPLRITFADLVAGALIFWATGYSLLMINSAGSDALFASLLLIAAGILALRGMFVLKTTGSSVSLWCVIGTHLGLGIIAVFSIGLALLFNAAVLIVYAIFRARHLGVPAIDRWGLLAEIIGFLAAPFLLFLVVSVS